MRQLLIGILVVALLGAGPASGQSGGGDRDAAIAVIQAQMDAFQADRGAEAFSYASQGIRSHFGTADEFMTMVRTAYRPVYRPQWVQFLDLVDTARGPAQQVLVAGPDGEMVLAIYFMERQPDGSWRIDGCALRRVTGDAV